MEISHSAVLLLILSMQFLTFTRVNSTSYIEFCSREPKNKVCSDYDKFQFDTLIGVHGVHLLLDESGCRKKVVFGFGQCLDVNPGHSLKMAWNGIWSPNDTSIVILHSDNSLQVHHWHEGYQELSLLNDANVYLINGMLHKLPQTNGHCVVPNRNSEVRGYYFFRNTSSRSHKDRVIIGSESVNGVQCSTGVLSDEFAVKNPTQESLPVPFPTIFRQCNLDCQKTRVFAAIQEEDEVNQVESRSWQGSTQKPEDPYSKDCDYDYEIHSYKDGQESEDYEIQSYANHQNKMKSVEPNSPKGRSFGRTYQNYNSKPPCRPLTPPPGYIATTPPSKTPWTPSTDTPWTPSTGTPWTPSSTPPTIPPPPTTDTYKTTTLPTTPPFETTSTQPTTPPSLTTHLYRTTTTTPGTETPPTPTSYTTPSTSTEFITGRFTHTTRRVTMTYIPTTSTPETTTPSTTSTEFVTARFTHTTRRVTMTFIPTTTNPTTPPLDTTSTTPTTTPETTPPMEITTPTTTPETTPPMEITTPTTTPSSPTTWYMTTTTPHWTPPARTTKPSTEHPYYPGGGVTHSNYYDYEISSYVKGRSKLRHKIPPKSNDLEDKFTGRVNRLASHTCEKLIPECKGGQTPFTTNL